MKILEAGTILDTLIKEILLDREDHTIEVTASVPARLGAGFTMISATGICYNPDINSIDLTLAEEGQFFPWNELDISAKDLILNTVVLALSSDDLFNQFRKQQ